MSNPPGPHWSALETLSTNRLSGELLSPERLLTIVLRGPAVVVAAADYRASTSRFDIVVQMVETHVRI